MVYKAILYTVHLLAMISEYNIVLCGAICKESALNLVSGKLRYFHGERAVSFYFLLTSQGLKSKYPEHS